MDTHVGAKLEIVAPRRVLTPTDFGYLFILLAVSVGIHGLLVSRMQVTARDGLEFARIALNLGHSRITPAKDGDQRPSVSETIKSSIHPPGYPAAILAVSQFLPEDEPQFRMLKAAQIASLLAAALAVFPTYWLGRMLFSSKRIGFAGALIFLTLPTIAHLTSDTLAESLYLLFATTSLLFGARALRRRSPGMALLCGIFAGLTYLVRPEGLMVPLAIGLTMAGVGILKKPQRMMAIGQLLALGIGFSFVGGPYMMAIGGLSNKTSFNELIERLKGNTPKPLWQGERHAQAVGGPMLLGDFYQDGNKGIWAASAIMKESSKAAHYSVFVLGLIGLALNRRRIACDPGLAALPILAMVNLAVISALALKVGYISERHTVLIVLILSLFTASSLQPVGQLLGFWPRWRSWGMLVAVVATSLPSALKIPHEGRTGHVYAGRYLAEHIGPRDAVIDPFCWAEWYAGRTLHGVPADPIPPAARWVIMETGDSPHSRLPRYQDALNVVNDQDNRAVLMFWWPDVPEAEARERAKVLVYRQAGDGR